MSSIVIPKFTLWNFQPFYIWTTPDNGGYVISEYRIESANGQAGYGVFQVCLSSSGPTRTFYVIPYGIYNLSIPLSGNQCSSLYTFYIPIGGLAQDLSISTSLPLEEGTYTLTFNIGYMQNNTFVVTDSRTVVIYIIPPLGCPPGTYCMMTFTCEMLGGKCLKYGCGCIGNIPTTICPGGTCCDYNLPGVNCCCAFPQMVPTTTTTTTLTTTTAPDLRRVAGSFPLQSPGAEGDGPAPAVREPPRSRMQMRSRRRWGRQGLRRIPQRDGPTSGI